MQESPRKKSSFLKIFLSILLILIFFAILFAAFLPTILSSSWGKEKITSIVNQSIPGKIQVENLSLSWFGSQNVQGLTLLDPENKAILSLDNISTNASLFSLLFHPLTPSFLEFNNLNATIIGDNEGNTNLRRALDKQCCTMSPKRETTPLSISLKNTQGLLNLFPEKGSVTLKISGDTEQNSQKGNFNIDAEMYGKGSFKNSDLTEILQSPASTLKVNADIINFPVELLDQIHSLRSPAYSGLLKELLGDELNLKINQHATADGMALQLQANSSTLSADGDILLKDGLTLANPAKIDLKISPASADKFLQILNVSTPWHLEFPTTASVTITHLQMPLKETKIHLNDLSLKANLDLAKTRLIHGEKNDNLAIEQLNAVLLAEPNSETATLSVNSKASQNQQPIGINFNLKLPKTVFLGDFSAFNLKASALNGKVEGLPLAIVDRIANMPFSDLAGPKGNLFFSLQTSNEQPIVELSFKSERLETSPLSFAIDSHLTLQKPAKVVLGLNHDFLNEKLQEHGPQIQAPATAHLILNSLSIPLTNFSTSLKLMYRIGLDAQLKLTSLRLANLPKIGGISLNDFALKITASPKHRPEIAASFNVQPDGSSLLADVLGKKAAFKTDATLGVNLASKLVANVFNIEMQSELARVELSGEMYEGDQLKLNAPSKVSYTLTTAGLQALGIEVSDYHFHHDSPLEMTIDSSHIPTTLNDLARLKLNGKLKVADFQLMKKAEKNKPLAIIDNLSADWSFNGSTKTISMDFAGITRLGETQAAGKINGSIALNNWLQNGSFDMAQARIQAKANANQLPTELLSVLSGQQALAPVIGSAIDLSIEANTSLEQNGLLSIDIKSENLSGGLGLTLGKNIQLSHNRPAEFSLKLTPMGYAALRQSIRGNSNSEFALMQPAAALFKLDSLHLSRENFMQSAIDAHFSLGPLVGMDAQTKNQVVLNSIQGHLTSPNLSGMIDFNIDANGQGENGSPIAWNTVGTIKNGFSEDGSINKDTLSIALDATINSLPVPLLCQFVCLDPKIKRKIEIVLGPKVNAVIKTHLQRMNGPLYIEVNGNNSRYVADAYINQGILTLNQDLKAQLTVTPQLGEYVLKDLIPVFSGMLSAEQPVYLTVAKEGFAIPLRNPSITNITMPQAILDMGKVHFSGESQIAKVLDLLTPASSNQLVWLTPAYFSLNQGVLNLQRVDMLISDRYPIAAWGDVDIGRDRVNMVIALAGNAISRAFNVPSISNSYFLQLPLTGRLNNPSIDKAKAVARISALVAQSRGGPEGLLIGTVLDIASGGLTERAVPAPTTNPLPWQDLMNDQGVPSEGKSKEKNKLNPMNEIEKGASSLLKKIFR
jgi:hypothetical protein